MRFKEDVREDAGENLTDRMLVPIEQTTVPASEDEEKVYAALSELREETKRNKGNEDWKNNVLVQYGIYKQFLSSPESCRKTLRKRIVAVQKHSSTSPELLFLDGIDSLLSSMSIRESSRYKLLKAQLDEIGWNGSPASPRVLVFTEYRETQDALAEALSNDYKLNYSSKFEQQPKQVLATINGSCPDTCLMDTVEAFGTASSELRMLLATDVASEGVNLHHQCHNIIHYDLPWSIITLIQRNGRIDRFGQLQNPVLRYLRVSTRDGMLKGDESIFERLIEKVEEINRSTRQGETVLKLYDPEAEERYIAQKGILHGDSEVLEKAAAQSSPEANELETILSQANPSGQEDFLKFLLGETDEAPSQSTTLDSADKVSSRLRLYDDRRFLIEGYRYLAELSQNYSAIEENGKVILLSAPKDLCRRLGAPSESNDVVFGATAIPSEAWPQDNQFRLSDDSDRIELAIRAARNTSGHWSRELMATDQQPILKWITERLLMLMKRGECPHITSRKLEKGELCFCFIGQVSSRAGAPLAVDAHAISFRKGGGFKHRPLREALDRAGFDSLVNEGKVGDLDAIRGPLIASAVEASLDYLRKLGHQHVESLLPLLRRENRRLRNWKNRREELLASRIEKLSPNHPKAKMYRKDLEEMDAYIRDREENWQDTYFTASTEPSTQLVLVIEGLN